MVLQAEDEEGAEVRHVLFKLARDAVGDRANGHQRLLVHRRVLRVEDLEEELHQPVGKGDHLRAELLHDDLQRAAQQALQLVLLLPVVRRDDLHREGALELVAQVRYDLSQIGHRVRRRLREHRVERLEGRRAQVVLRRVRPLRRLDQRANHLEEVWRELRRLRALRDLKALGEVVDRPAHVARDTRLVAQRLEKHATRLKQLVRVRRVHARRNGAEGAGVQVAHAADRPRRRVTHLHGRVTHQCDDHRHGLRDKRLEHRFGRALEHRAKCEKRCLAEPPFR
mmetsp:Transcript_2259/g.7168  ORF Transcript_2259/g.7168 Transcript_2259/m.7168 type:complete len:282 (-) Transcript_2259:1170-2015(-)